MKTYTYTTHASLNTGEPAQMSGTVTACCLRTALLEAVESTRLSYADFRNGAWIEVRDPETGDTEHFASSLQKLLAKIGGKPRPTAAEMAE